MSTFRRSDLVLFSFTPANPVPLVNLDCYLFSSKERSIAVAVDVVRIHWQSELNILHRLESIGCDFWLCMHHMRGVLLFLPANVVRSFGMSVVI